MNIVCVICQEFIEESNEEAASSDAAILSCGHLFHYHCLNEWLERNKTCPQCRKSTEQNNVTKVYFTTNQPEQDELEQDEQEQDESELEDSYALLLYELDLTINQLELKVKEIATLKEDVHLLNGLNISLENKVQELEQNQEKYLSELDLAHCNISIKDDEIKMYKNLLF